MRSAVKTDRLQYVMIMAVKRKHKGVKQMNIRRAAALSLALGISFCTPAFAATEGTWIENGTKFQKTDGSIARNEWIEGENKSYFYVGADGSYVTGWQHIKETNGSASHDYYFNPADGAMFYDTYTPDGYWVNADGVWTGESRNGNVSDTPGTAAQDSAPAETAQDSASAGTEAAQNAAGSGAGGNTDSNAQQTADSSVDSTEPQKLEPGVITDGYSESNAAALIELINQKRAEAGKPSLSIDADLEAAAETRSKEIASYADDSRIYLRPEEHYLAEAKDTSRSMTNSSVTAVSETARKQFTRGSSILITESAAWRVGSAQEAVDDWFAKNSDGEDKSNKSFILDTGNNGFNAIGASCYVKDGKQYYSLFLGVRQ